jgi:hypothetical protein
MTFRKTSGQGDGRGSGLVLPAHRTAIRPDAERLAPQAARRGGFSLMEVMLASSILLTCLIVLGELAAVGRRHARDAEQLSIAQLACRSRLNEILAGAAPLESQEATEVPELPGWSLAVQVESLGKFGLSAVTVTVTRAPPADLETAEGVRGKFFSLTRWVHAPTSQASPADSLLEGDFP